LPIAHYKLSYQGEEAFVGIGLSGEVVEGEEIMTGAVGASIYF
jgi:hypothetical protein